MNKVEYTQLKAKLENNQRLLTDFEFAKDGLYDKWRKWELMPQAEKTFLFGQWQEYYSNCKKGKPFMLLQFMRKAVLKSNKPLIRRISWAAKYMQANPTKYFLKKPSLIDPSELKRQIQPYLDLKANTERLADIVKGYRESYENTKKQSSFEPVL
jgi:hypothetical protein